MSLEDLQRAKQRLEAQWRSARNQEAMYREKAKEIQKVYDEMKKVKGDVKLLRKGVSNYIDDNHSYFYGENYKNYQVKGQEIVSGYKILIQQIDINLDKLNDEITKYENLALQTYGWAGNLLSQINNVANQIQNWVN